MASRRFFPYDDDYYSGDDAFFFPDVESVRPAVVHPCPFAYYNQPCPFFPAGSFFHVRESSRPRSVSVPVHFVGSESRELPVSTAAVVEKKRELSASEAVIRVQAAARGFMARRMVRKVRAVEREAGEIAIRVTAQAEAMRGDSRARTATVEELMRLLLRLDAVRGARGYRRRVTKRVLALQDAVDALELPPPPVTGTASAVEALAAEIVEAVDGLVASGAVGLEEKKVTGMVAAVCEQSAWQCAEIGALAERVDTLERALRRVEEADRRRRRKKILKQGKSSRKPVRGFFSD